MATRWRSPPDSSPGKRDAVRDGSRTCSSSSASSRSRLGAVDATQDPRRPHDRLADAMARIERLVGVLEDDLDPPPVVAGAIARVRGARTCRRAGSSPPPGGEGRRCSAPRSSCPSRTRRRAPGRIRCGARTRSPTAVVCDRPARTCAAAPRPRIPATGSLGGSERPRAGRRARAAACARARGSARCHRPPVSSSAAARPCRQVRPGRSAARRRSRAATHRRPLRCRASRRGAVASRDRGSS